MKTVRDMLQHGTDVDVANNFAKSAALLRRQAETIPIAPVNDYVGLSVQRILRYVADETEVVPSALRNDIKLFAWRTRNIFESFLLLKHCMASPENAEQFCAQCIGDEKTILEGFLSLAHEDSCDLTPFRARIAKAKDILEKYGFNKASSWRIDLLADAVGIKDDYAAFYKLYSKYVHPSSWVIIADRSEFDCFEYWEAFIINAQLTVPTVVALVKSSLNHEGFQSPMTNTPINSVLYWY
jgi:hypothetical protein